MGSTRRLNKTLGQLVLSVKSTNDFAASEAISQLKHLLDGSCDELETLCDQIRNMLEEEVFDERHLIDKSMAEQREHAMRMATRVLHEGLITVQDVRHNPVRVMAWFEKLSYASPEIALKFAVQFNLWGGCLAHLSGPHNDTTQIEFLTDGTNNGSVLGAFALTELGHGSNVARLQTTVRLDREKQCFELHTPSFIDQKYWPGGLFQNSTHAAVFARYTHDDGVDRGVHCFVVPLRSAPKLPPFDGIYVRDVGLTTCFPGMDNGGMAFHHVRLPLSSMLSRFAYVDADTLEYHASLPQHRLFGAHLAPFVGGRIAAAYICLGHLKAGLTLATQYCRVRRQGGPGEDRLLLDHTPIRMRLGVATAVAYGLSAALRRLTNENIAADRSQDMKRMAQVHERAACLKAWGVWWCHDMLQQCRECMGGQGLRSVNRVATLRDAVDMWSTGEGDNTVLLKSAAKGLIKGTLSTLENGSDFARDELDAVAQLRHVYSNAKDAVAKFDALDDAIPQVKRATLAHTRNYVLQALTEMRSQNAQTDVLRRVFLAWASGNEPELANLCSARLNKQGLPLVQLVRAFDVPQRLCRLDFP
ncbi:MAG: hypothetical protein MHM6MM_005271 [Cercozoa sp. M6MM]